eukprot:PLAT3292.34.p1 GENE.PLAT3292.34~~PLAT3292.34.p1  ORF type:complete len:846 (-),score=387.14 PLAT3292.34:102-2522(-)
MSGLPWVINTKGIFELMVQEQRKLSELGLWSSKRVQTMEMLLDRVNEAKYGEQQAERKRRALMRMWKSPKRPMMGTNRRKESFSFSELRKGMEAASVEGGSPTSSPSSSRSPYSLTAAAREELAAGDSSSSFSSVGGRRGRRPRSRAAGKAKHTREEGGGGGGSPAAATAEERRAASSPAGDPAAAVPAVGAAEAGASEKKAKTAMKPKKPSEAGKKGAPRRQGRRRRSSSARGRGRASIAGLGDSDATALAAGGGAAGAAAAAGDGKRGKRGSLAARAVLSPRMTRKDARMHRLRTHAAAASESTKRTVEAELLAMAEAEEEERLSIPSNNLFAREEMAGIERAFEQLSSLQRERDATTRVHLSGIQARITRLQFRAAFVDLLGSDEEGLVNRLYMLVCGAHTDMMRSGITFRQFAAFTSQLVHGTAATHVLIAFAAYDLDGDGLLSARDLFSLFRLRAATSIEEDTAMLLRWHHSVRDQADVKGLPLRQFADLLDGRTPTLISVLRRGLLSHARRRSTAATVDSSSGSGSGAAGSGGGDAILSAADRSTATRRLLRGDGDGSGRASIASLVLPRGLVLSQHETEVLMALYNKHNTEGSGVTRESFDHMLDSLQRGPAAVPEQSALVRDRMFAVLDKDGSAAVDMREFLSGMAVLLKGNFDQRAHFCFSMYDLDGDGTISSEEMQTLIEAGALNSLLGLRSSSSIIGAMTESIMSASTVISFHDFRRALVAACPDGLFSTSMDILLQADIEDKKDRRKRRRAGAAGGGSSGSTAGGRSRAHRTGRGRQRTSPPTKRATTPRVTVG